MAEVKRLTSRLSISDFVKEPPIPLTPVPENLPLLVKEKGDQSEFRMSEFARSANAVKTTISTRSPSDTSPVVHKVALPGGGADCRTCVGSLNAPFSPGTRDDRDGRGLAGRGLNRPWLCCLIY